MITVMLEKFGNVGGYYIQACRYRGTGNRYNLFPQNRNLNNSVYKAYY